MKRPKTILLLFIVYVVAFFRGLQHIFFFTSSVNYHIYNQANLTFLFFISAILSVIFYGLTAWFLWKPKWIGFWIAISGIAINFIMGLIGCFIGFRNPEFFKQAYILSRVAKGLPVRQEVINMTSSPLFILTTVGIGIGISLLISVLFVWKREYFFR